jgi:hypothetical protein
MCENVADEDDLPPKLIPFGPEHGELEKGDAVWREQPSDSSAP